VPLPIDHLQIEWPRRLLHNANAKETNICRDGMKLVMTTCVQYSALSNMKRKQFKRILDRYLEGNASLREQIFIENWYANISSNKPARIEPYLDSLERKLWNRITKATDTSI
jgi:hypothetical protein